MVSDNGGPGTAQEIVGRLTQGIGRVEVDDVGPQTRQDDRLSETEGHRGHRGQSAGLDDADALEFLNAGVLSRVADQDNDLMSSGGLSLSQDLDVVFDTPQDGVVIFVNMKEVHSSSSSKGYTTPSWSM